MSYEGSLYINKDVTVDENVSFDSVDKNDNVCGDLVKVSVGKSRKDMSYKVYELPFSRFADRLSRTVYTAESFEEYLCMSKDAQDDVKDVGGFVGGVLRDGKRRKDCVLGRQVLTLDVDFGYKGMWDVLTMTTEFALVMYTTHKHSEDNERFRLVIPLSRVVDCIEYEAIARLVAGDIGIDYFDDSTYEPSRLMYFPSTSKGAEFRFEYLEDDWLNVDEFLSRYDDYKDVSSWPVSSRVLDFKKCDDVKQQNPLEKDGIIGAFCKTYDVHQAIDKYLSDVYEKTLDSSRYTYKKGTTSGGLVVYEDGLFAYSHHGSDPCFSKMCNAYDLVKNHLFKDFREDETYAKMLELLVEDDAVMQKLGEEKIENAKKEFSLGYEDCVNEDNEGVSYINRLDNKNNSFNIDVNSKKDNNDSFINQDSRNKNNNINSKDNCDIDNNKSYINDSFNNEGNCNMHNNDSFNCNDNNTCNDENSGWISSLEVDKKGRYKNTINNIVIVLENDYALKNKIASNEFTHQITIKESLPWVKIKNKKYGDIWTDADDSNLRHYLEKVYGIKSQQAIFDAISVVARKNSFHPIKDYLNSVKWDGINRVDNLFIDYLGAHDDEYTKAIARKMLVAAVSRIMNPGVKFDYMAVFVGPQGIGKSHLINLLGKDWYSDSINTVQGKEAYEQLQEAWIVEMAELSAAKKAETESVKHFISKREDIYRVAYGRRVEKFPRQCVFFGTTNENEFLKDKSGNRRYWPIKVGVNKVEKSMFKELDENEINQIWAEAVCLYKKGEKLILEGDVLKIAIENQERHLDESPKEGMIREYLNTLLPVSWNEMDISARRRYISGGDLSNFENGSVKREKVCAMEIWVELFNGDPKMLTPVQAREINDILRKIPQWEVYGKGTGKLKFGKIYGYQRAFKLIDSIDD